MVEDIDVNEIIFDTFEAMNNWKSVKRVRISSRGVSGFTEDVKHFVIVLCVDVSYLNEESVMNQDNMLIVVDIDDKYLLTWFMFENDAKCVKCCSIPQDHAKTM